MRRSDPVRSLAGRHWHPSADELVGGAASPPHRLLEPLRQHTEFTRIVRSPPRRFEPRDLDGVHASP